VKKTWFQLQIEDLGGFMVKEIFRYTLYRISIVELYLDKP